MKNILSAVKNLFGNKKGLAKVIESLEQCFDKQFSEELEEARKKVSKGGVPNRKNKSKGSSKGIGKKISGTAF